MTFRVARRITRNSKRGTMELVSRSLESTPAYRVRWSNTIFVGSNRSNPWVELFEDRMAYHFKQSQDSTLSYVAESITQPATSKLNTRSRLIPVQELPIV